MALDEEYLFCPYCGEDARPWDTRCPVVDCRHRVPFHGARCVRCGQRAERSPLWQPPEWLGRLATMELGVWGLVILLVPFLVLRLWGGSPTQKDKQAANALITQVYEKARVGGWDPHDREGRSMLPIESQYGRVLSYRWRRHTHRTAAPGLYGNLKYDLRVQRERARTHEVVYVHAVQSRTTHYQPRIMDVRVEPTESR